MKKETKSELYTLISESELYTLISKYEKRLSQEKKQEGLAKAQGAASASEFIKIRDKIIVPIMEEMSNKLQEHGHNISILEEDDWIDWGDYIELLESLKKYRRDVLLQLKKH